MVNDGRNEMTREAAIYAELKLRDRLTPGRTHWTVLKRKASVAAAAERADAAYHRARARARQGR